MLFEKERLEKEIEQLKEYRTQWEETVNAYKKAQDDMTAAALLGANWREEIANKDIGVLNTFSANYQSTLAQLHEILEPQITQAQSIVTAYDNEITKQNELKSQQQKYLDFYKTYSSDFANDLINRLSETASKNQALYESILTGSSAIIGNAFKSLTNSVKKCSLKNHSIPFFVKMTILFYLPTCNLSRVLV